MLKGKDRTASIIVTIIPAGPHTATIIPPAGLYTTTIPPVGLTILPAGPHYTTIPAIIPASHPHTTTTTIPAHTTTIPAITPAHPHTPDLVSHLCPGKGAVTGLDTTEAHPAPVTMVTILSRDPVELTDLVTNVMYH